jgi:hypothetical protein
MAVGKFIIMAYGFIFLLYIYGIIGHGKNQEMACYCDQKSVPPLICKCFDDNMVLFGNNKKNMDGL